MVDDLFFPKKKKENLTSLSFLVQTKFFRKPRRIIWPHFFLWKRFAQKKKLPLAYNLKKKYQPVYRVSAQANYKKLLSLSTNWKLKYLLQDLIQTYFTLEVHVKISWPLSQFKNFKFYRLLFPMYKSRRLKKKNYFFKKPKKKSAWRKKYRSLQQNTKHLQFDFPTWISKKKILRGQQKQQTDAFLNLGKKKKKRVSL